MMNFKRAIRKTFDAAVVAAAIMAGGCNSLVYDDLDPCPTTYHLKFRYDYNMKYADAFPAEVDAVAVWAFDHNGKLVWQHKEEGPQVSSPGYEVELPLEPGRYDFVAWCGLKTDSRFSLSAPDAEMKDQLTTVLDLSDPVRGDDSGKVSRHQLTGLYHSHTQGVEIVHNPDIESDNEVTLSLTKDTNYIKILL